MCSLFRSGRLYHLICSTSDSPSFNPGERLDPIKLILRCQAGENYLSETGDLVFNVKTTTSLRLFACQCFWHAKNAIRVGFSVIYLAIDPSVNLLTHFSEINLYYQSLFYVGTCYCLYTQRIHLSHDLWLIY